MKRIALISAMVLTVVLVGGAKGCEKEGSGDPSASASVTPFSKPGGEPAVPPQHGNEVDPQDEDFFKPQKPPKDAPEGTVTYEVRAQMYNASGESIGGISTAFINASSNNPRALGGVAGSRVGPFPYNKESVRLPFQFPIFIQSGIVVSVGATFHVFADKGEILACWFMSPGGFEIRGTRSSQQAVGGNSLLSVNCLGNIG